MPPIVVPNEGQLELATCMAIKTDFSGYEFLFDLFKNDYTPDQSSTASSFVIADFQGYEFYTWDRTDWMAPITVENQAVLALVSNPLEFNNTGPDQDIYGYFVRSVQTNKVLWCQRWDLTPSIGIQYSISFNVTLNVFGSYP